MQYGILNVWDEQQQKYVPMPVIKGDSYILTQQDKEDIASIVIENLADK